VHVTPSTMPPHGIPNRQGQLYLDGPINSLALRGPELSIDNIRIAVPEPTAVWDSCFHAWSIRASTAHAHRKCIENKSGSERFIAV
jgi:hypothetical protein